MFFKTKNYIFHLTKQARMDILTCCVAILQVEVLVNSDNGTAGSISLMNISTERKLTKTDAQVCFSTEYLSFIMHVQLFSEIKNYIKCGLLADIVKF